MGCVSVTSDGTASLAARLADLVWRVWAFKAAPTTEEDVFAFHRSAPFQEEITKFRGVEFLVLAGVEAEKNGAARVEVTRDVIEEKAPFVGPPPPVAFAIELNRKCGDEIEFPARIRQRLEWCDRPDPALDPEQLEEFAEKRKEVGIQTEATMTEPLRNEEKEAGAAAEIEDRFWSAPVQPQILDPRSIKTKPARNVRVFRVMFGGISI